MWMLASVGEQGRVGRVGVVVEEGFQPLESALRLRILDLLDSGPGEDMMTAVKTLVESEAAGQATQSAEGNLASAVPLRTWTRRESRLATTEAGPNTPARPNVADLAAAAAQRRILLGGPPTTGPHDRR